jgi:hypothetical protein
MGRIVHLSVGLSELVDQFDDNDNFGPTTLMDKHYATLAETRLGVPAGRPPPRLSHPSSRKPHSQLAIRRETAQNQWAAPSALT